MGLHGAKNIESRFTRYVEGLVSVIGHADRAVPLHDYCLGLVMPGERKSIEPMAALTAPGRTAAQHQSLLHFVGQGGWSDDDVLGKVREMVLPAIERYGAIEAWIIDDTSFPKQGRHSVGVSHQYCGQLGKQANCQVAVTLSITNHDASLPVAYRLYLPKAWAEDDARRCKAKVPEDIAFKTKPEIGSTRSAGRMRSGFLAGWCCWMPATATTPSCVRALRNWDWPMWPAFCRKPWYGSQACGRAGRPRRGAATRPIRPRSRTSRFPCVRERGARSNGGKAPMNGCPRGLLGCAFP